MFGGFFGFILKRGINSFRRKHFFPYKLLKMRASSCTDLSDKCTKMNTVPAYVVRGSQVIIFGSSVQSRACALYFHYIPEKTNISTANIRKTGQLALKRCRLINSSRRKTW